MSARSSAPKVMLPQTSINLANLLPSLDGKSDFPGLAYFSSSYIKTISVLREVDKNGTAFVCDRRDSRIPQ